LQMLHLVTHESQKVLQLAALAQISQLNPLEAQVAVLSLGMLVDCLQIMLRHYHLALLHEATSMDQIDGQFLVTASKPADVSRVQ